MAGCDTVSLTTSPLTCTQSPKAWATALVADAQTQLDYIVSCIRDTPAVWCDICQMKAALTGDPLAYNMVDFSNIQYAATAAVCRIPWPYLLQPRWGRATSAEKIELDGWLPITVLFDPPFDTHCVLAKVRITSCHQYMTLPTPGPQCAMQWVAIVQEDSISTTGFTVWFKSADPDRRYLTFRWIAWGY